VSLVQLSAHMGPAMASTAYLAVCLVHRLVDSASSPPPSPALSLVRARGNGLLLLTAEPAYPSHLRCAAGNLYLLLCAACGRRPDGSRDPNAYNGCASEDEEDDDERPPEEDASCSPSATPLDRPVSPSSVQEDDSRDASDEPPSEEAAASAPAPPPPPPSFAFRRPPARTLRQDETEADVHILAVALMREGVSSEAPDPSLAEQGCQLAGHLSFQRRSAQTRLLAAGAAEVLCGVVANKLSGSTRMVLLSLRALLNLSTCADGQVRRLLRMVHVSTGRLA